MSPEIAIPRQASSLTPHASQYIKHIQHRQHRHLVSQTMQAAGGRTCRCAEIVQGRSQKRRCRCRCRVRQCLRAVRPRDRETVRAVDVRVNVGVRGFDKNTQEGHTALAMAPPGPLWTLLTDAVVARRSGSQILYDLVQPLYSVPPG